MSFLHPTPGQLLDRLQIVQLKLRHLHQDREAAQWKHFWLEGNEIDAVLRTAAVRHRLRNEPALYQLGARLEWVNQQLWRHNEDLAHALATHAEPACNALQVFQLNGERIQLIEQIDRELGVAHPPEKVGYAQPQDPPAGVPRGDPGDNS